ncbi:MAG TPA: hypothetical protein VN714_04355 [Trebonia sp.]|nr:hypothetical protein [Trebonia sp.]
MSDLLYKTGTGENHYVACIVGPEPKVAPHSRLPALRALNPSEPFPAEGLIVDVPAGSVSVTSALRDLEGNVPSGVTVSISRPDGTAYTQSTEPNAEGTVVEVQAGSVVGLLVVDPEPGSWKIQIESANAEGEFAFWFSTMPTAEVQSTIDVTLTKMADSEALAAIEADFEVGESWGCFWCKVGCAALAVVIAGLIVAGATFITAGAAPVAALAAALSWSAAAVVAGLQGLVAAGATLVGIVLAYICSWSNACPSPGPAVEAGP